MTRNARGADFAAFEEFVGRVEHRLRVALVASYGAHDGRAATLDALSWAWEHWDRVRTMDNAVGYLYRVGQSASRAYATRPIPFERHQPIAGEVLIIGPETLRDDQPASRTAAHRRDAHPRLRLDAA